MKTLTTTLAALAATMLLAAQASAAPPSTLRFLDVSVEATPAFDAGTGAPRPGDRIYLHDSLYRWDGVKRGARAGSVRATLTFMSSFGDHGATAELSGQLFLAGGSIWVDGVVHVSGGPSRFNLAILGGTGRFAGARGVLSIRDLVPNGDRSAMILHLLP